MLNPDEYYMENEKLVFTKKYHLRRGHCCKNGCKHCPYDDRKNIMIILVAIEQEVPTLHDRPNLFFTGVGKVNAAHVATKAILEYKNTNGKLPDVVVNYGTAGSISDVKGLVECSGFIERDMDCTPLDFPKYKTPFEDGEDIIGEKGIVCGTGDSFVINKNELIKDMQIVDMEAYAIAKVCKNLNVPFRSFKYISDEANEEAGKDWKDYQSLEAEKLFTDKLTELEWDLWTKQQ